MLSIIICSISPEYLSALRRNIEETVGVPYEIIAINNSIHPKGITAVYNEGVSKAKYEHICLIHEDVAFRTNNWGQIILTLFNDEGLGLLGVAGSKYKPKVPSGWRPGTTGPFTKINVIQHFKHNKKVTTHQYINTDNETISEVACIDGLFLASRKSILLDIPFDEEMLKGFHGYDVDISIAIGQKYKVAVTYEILLEHLSEGSLSEDWIDSTLKLHEKWSNALPITIGHISQREKMRLEIRTFKNFTKTCKKFASLQKVIYALDLSETKNINFIAYVRMKLLLLKYYPLSPTKSNFWERSNNL